MTHDTIRLAKAFSKQVRAAFTAGELRTIRERNKTYDDDVCATHDFADANMLMLDAFIATFERNPLDAPGGLQDDDTRLWNAAWAIAKAAGFTATRLTGDTTMTTLQPKLPVTRLPRDIHEGDWHDAPLRWLVSGPGTEQQMFSTRKSAELYARIRRRAASFSEAGNEYVRRAV